MYVGLKAIPLPKLLTMNVKSLDDMVITHETEKKSDALSELFAMREDKTLPMATSDAVILGDDFSKRADMLNQLMMAEIARGSRVFLVMMSSLANQRIGSFWNGYSYKHLRMNEGKFDELSVPDRPFNIVELDSLDTNIEKGLEALNELFFRIPSDARPMVVAFADLERSWGLGSFETAPTEAFRTLWQTLRIRQGARVFAAFETCVKETKRGDCLAQFVMETSPTWIFADAESNYIRGTWFPYGELSKKGTEFFTAFDGMTESTDVYLVRTAGDHWGIGTLDKTFSRPEIDMLGPDDCPWGPEEQPATGSSLPSNVVERKYKDAFLSLFKDMERYKRRLSSALRRHQRNFQGQQAADGGK